MESLKRKVDEQGKIIAELSSQLQISKNPSFADEVISIKNKIEKHKNEESRIELDKMHEKFVKNAPPIETHDHVASLVDYAVDFIEECAPKMMMILDIAISDKSMFKLNTCITLILIVLPKIIDVTVTVLKMMVNCAVYIKNRAIKAFDDITQPPMIELPITPKKKKLSLRKLLGGA